MRLLDIALRALSNLRNNMLRTALTVLALTVGSLSLNLGLALTNALDISASRLIDTNLRTITIERYEEPKLSTQLGLDTASEFSLDEAVQLNETNDTGEFELLPIELAELEQISKIDGVESVIPDYSFDARYAAFTELQDQKLNLQSLETYQGERIRLAGESQDDGVFKLGPDEAIVNELYARTLEVDPQSLIGADIMVGFGRSQSVEGKIFTRSLNIVAVEKENIFFGDTDKSQGDRILVSPETAAQMNQQIVEDEAVDVWLPLRATAIVDESVAEGVVNLKIKEVGDSIQTFSSGELLDDFKDFIRVLTYGLAGFSGIILLAGSFGIVNTQLMSVYERTAEIGLLRALGARASDIMKLFMFEAAIIGILGALLGGFFALVIQVVVNISYAEQLEEIGGRILILNPLHAAYVVIGFASLAIFAGTLPARKAQQVDPVEALRV